MGKIFTMSEVLEFLTEKTQDQFEKYQSSTMEDSKSEYDKYEGMNMLCSSFEHKYTECALVMPNKLKCLSPGEDEELHVDVILDESKEPMIMECKEISGLIEFSFLVDNEEECATVKAGPGDKMEMMILDNLYLMVNVHPRLHKFLWDHGYAEALIHKFTRISNIPDDNCPGEWIQKTTSTVFRERWLD